MDTQDKLRELLQDRKTTYVASRAGVHKNTIHLFLRNRDWNLKPETVEKLVGYFKERGQI